MLKSMYAAVLCGCSAAVGLRIAEWIVPTERFQKQVRLLFSALMLIVLLKPLTHLQLPSMKETDAGAKQYSQKIAALAESAREDAVRESILNALNRELTAHGVSCTVKAVIMHISETGGIMIDEVRITGNLLTGAVYLHEWLGDEISVTGWKEEETCEGADPQVFPEQ